MILRRCLDLGVTRVPPAAAKFFQFNFPFGPAGPAGVGVPLQPRVQTVQRLSQRRKFSTNLPQSDCYKTLGLKRDSTDAEIKKAYFELAKKHHPDSNDGAGGEKFAKIGEAYEAVSKNRKSYNQYYDANLSSSSGSSRSSGSSSSGSRYGSTDT